MEEENHIFRLIAIRTGTALTQEEKLLADPKTLRPKQNYDYLKSLKPKTSFHFLNSFKVSQDGKSLRYIPRLDLQGLYSFKKNEDVHLEVSAVVGKNGSGKSTLLEVLYLAIHNLSVEEGILLDEDRNKVVIPENYLRCQLYFQTAPEKFYCLNLRFEDHKAHYSFYKGRKTKANNFVFDNDSIESDFNLKDFFYSVVVNYSVYGLNETRMGIWIRHLFHKNDSYQAPIVINPMRSMGNYDINREESLNRNRLIANSAINYTKGKTKTYITDDQYLDELFFKINNVKIRELEELNVEIDKVQQKVSRSILDVIERSDFTSSEEIVNATIRVLYPGKEPKSVTYQDEVFLYIVKKLFKIASIYEKYGGYLKEEIAEEWQTLVKVFDKGQFEDYLAKLKEDNSHVTFKLRQALNFLIIDPLHDEDPGAWTNVDKMSRKRPNGWAGLQNLTGTIYRISFNDLAKRISNQHDSIINCIPPGLFKAFINVKSERTKQPSQLENMSSGELQLVNSLQSTLYHLNNLDSYSDEPDGSDKIPYRNVLLLFDEIELYFHPEYQRKFIATVIKQLDELELNLIKGIHILCVTHSPFILSDIPRSNILKLDKGKPKLDDKLTFAANIHEMLKDSFYMEASTGQYSIETINEIIEDLNELLALKGKRNKKELREQKIAELLITDAYKIISSIGDVVVRRKLLTMYYECMGESDKVAKKKMISEEIKRLQTSLKMMDS